MRTVKLIYRDGHVGHGVTVTTLNLAALGVWLGDSFQSYREKDQSILLLENNSRRVRRAYIGDIIVKTEKGFSVIREAAFSRHIKSNKKNKE